MKLGTLLFYIFIFLDNFFKIYAIETQFLTCYAVCGTGVLVCYMLFGLAFGTEIMGSTLLTAFLSCDLVCLENLELNQRIMYNENLKAIAGW